MPTYSPILTLCNLGRNDFLPLPHRGAYDPGFANKTTEYLWTFLLKWLSILFFKQRFVLIVKIIFLMWTIFKVFTGFITILLLFYVFIVVCLFWPWGMWILAPQLRIEPTTPALKGEVLPLDHQQSPLFWIFYLFIYWAVPCLSFGTWDLWSSLWHAKSLVAAYELLVAAFGI